MLFIIAYLPTTCSPALFPSGGSSQQVNVNLLRNEGEYQPPAQPKVG